MPCCVRLAPALLIHVNLLLCLVAGAGLATAARLKWDPTTYVGLRALLPREYRAAAAALCAASAALLALAHLAASALALRASSPRLARALLVLYAAMLAVATCLETAWGAWTATQVLAWLESDSAAPLRDLAELREHVRPLLALLARYHSLPDHLKELLEEAEEDAPRNLYVAGAAVALAMVLQPAAALLALLCAAAPVARRGKLYSDEERSREGSISYSVASTESEKAPLRTSYRNGRLVVLPRPAPAPPAH